MKGRPMERASMLLLTDATLSSDARVLGLYLASKGPGVHAVPREELADLLSNNTPKARVQRALGQLERKHWIHRTAGGRGHPDRFEFRGREMRHLNDTKSEDRGPESQPLKDSGRRIEHLNGSEPDRGRQTEHLNAPDPLSGREMQPLKASGGDYRGGKEPSSTQKVAVNETATETERDDVSKQPGRADPVGAMWEVYREVLAGPPPEPKLSTGNRRAVLRKLYDEQLKKHDDPLAVFRLVCEAVTRSEHHMSTRAYQLPESLFRNAERRERWVLEALNPRDGPAALPAGDRRILEYRRSLDEIDLEASA